MCTPNIVTGHDGFGRELYTSTMLFFRVILGLDLISVNNSGGVLYLHLIVHTNTQTPI
jgi:hypothetical protein